MPCKAPSFWWRKTGMAAALLRPAAALYQGISRVHQHQQDAYTASIPVICVGNIVAGGSGKTPAVQALTLLAHDEGLSEFPVVLLRGYGGTLKGPTSVNPHIHDDKAVGDEALLHAAQVPTIIARDRDAGVKLAELNGADCVFMDDGLQNPSVRKTISFLMIDEAQGIGNGLTLPAGPLREPLEDALDKCDAIILNGTTLPFTTDKPAFKAHIEPLNPPDTDKPYIAFAGLGRPEKFKETLEQYGATLMGWHSFPDHHKYKDSDIAPLIKQAEEQGVRLITTAKDHIRLPRAYKEQVEILHIQMVFEEPDALVQFMKSKIM